MKLALKNVFIAAALLVSAPAAADGPVFRFGVDMGGAKIGTLQFEDGSSETIDAGSGAYVEGGYQFQTPLLNRPQFSTELSVGYKTDGAYASDVSVDFSRITTSLTQYVHIGRLHFGVAITGHFMNKLSVEEDYGSNYEDNINNSYGMALLAGIKIQNNWRGGLRFVSMDYTNYGEKFDANSGGLFVDYAFN